MLTLLLTASAAGASDAATPPRVNACALLSSGELSAVLNTPVEEGTRHDDGVTSAGAYSSTCIWKVRNERVDSHDPQASLGGADYVILDAFSWPSRDGAESFLQSFWSAADHNEIPMRPVALKIGDDSLWWGDGVAVRTGAVSYGVSVVMHSADLAGRRVWEESLAKKILPRIRGPR